MSDQEQTRVVRTHTLLKSLVICNINIIVLLIFKLFHTNTDVFLTCLWRLQVFFSRVSMTSDQDGVKGDVCSAIAHFSLFSLRLYSNNMTQPLTRLILTVTVRDCDWWEEELNSPNTRIHMCTHCVCVCVVPHEWTATPHTLSVFRSVSWFFGSWHVGARLQWIYVSSRPVSTQRRRTEKTRFQMIFQRFYFEQ